MLNYRTVFAVGAALGVLGLPAVAAAQDDSADLMQMSHSNLRSEIAQRYDAALAVSQEPATVSADSNRYMWASQAKVQCGIALGFLKSSTKDAVSVGKCAEASLRMQNAMPPAMPQPPQLGGIPAANCAQPVAGIIFFDWDSAVLPESAVQTIDSTVNSMTGCQWSGLVVTGHTDRSGSDSYNVDLSVRRANAVASLLEGRGISSGQVEVSGRGESEPKVPTMDGERNPTNRRVEITVR